MSKKNPLLFDSGYYIDPRQIIDALHDAGQEMNFSNYHNDKFARAEKIIRDWCKHNNVPIGPTKETIEKRRQARHEKLMQDMRGDDHKAAIRAMRLLTNS